MVSIFWVLILAGMSVQGQESPIYYNPIRTHSRDFESVVQVGEFYYIAGLQTRPNGIGRNIEIHVQKSRYLSSWSESETAKIYSLPDSLQEYLEHCKIEKIEGDVLISFVVSSSNKPSRFLVIKPVDHSNLLGYWDAPTQLMPENGALSDFPYAIMKHNNKLYLIGGEDIGERTTGLVIRPMESPTEVSENRTIIHVPKEEWECENMGFCTSTCPAAIYNGNISYIVFMALGHSQYSSLAYISLLEGEDPMVASNWRAPSGLVFGYDGGYPKSVGVASFTHSPDGMETWMYYKARTMDVWPIHMTIQGIDLITWNNVTGEPEFPELNHGPMPVPSGEKPY